MPEILTDTPAFGKLLTKLTIKLPYTGFFGLTANKGLNEMPKILSKNKKREKVNRFT